MFVWDEKKRRKVLADHGVDFGWIGEAFDDPFGVYFEDAEHSNENETRFNLIGLTARYGLVYVTFTYEESSVRLITVWKAEKWAISEYEQYKR